MSKIVIKPTNKKQIKLHDSIIVGVKNLSVGVLELTVEEINKLKNKEIFVSINKNIHNQDLPYLKEVLLNLKNIKGVIYYDVSIVNLKQELNLPYEPCNELSMGMSNDYIVAVKNGATMIRLGRILLR